MIDGVSRARPASREEALEVDADAIAWPFDGEYWRDELGTYIEVVPNECGRGAGGT